MSISVGSAHQHVMERCSAIQGSLSTLDMEEKNVQNLFTMEGL